MQKREFKQRKQLRLKGFNYASNSAPFFVTICTANKQPYFSDPNISEEIVSELEYRRLRREIRLFCYCIMPDHIHLFIALEENYIKKAGAFGERTLQNWVSAFKRHTSRMLSKMDDVKPLWQQNFYDHILRRDESLIEICQYILNNPVRKGMVSTWEGYPYSKIVDPLPL
jgi:putative transposase